MLRAIDMKNVTEKYSWDRGVGEDIERVWVILVNFSQFAWIKNHCAFLNVIKLNPYSIDLGKIEVRRDLHEEFLYLTSFD